MNVDDFISLVEKSVDAWHQGLGSKEVTKQTLVNAARTVLEGKKTKSLHVVFSLTDDYFKSDQEAVIGKLFQFAKEHKLQIQKFGVLEQ